MADRPDYVTCIARPAGTRKAWCGREVMCFDFLFQGIDHAAENGAQQGRLVTCPECAAAVQAALATGATTPQGWKLVPLEPTEEMRMAGVEAYNAHTSAMFFYVWEAMLAAAPSEQTTTREAPWQERIAAALEALEDNDNHAATVILKTALAASVSPSQEGQDKPANGVAPTGEAQPVAWLYEATDGRRVLDFQPNPNSAGTWRPLVLANGETPKGGING